MGMEINDCCPGCGACEEVCPLGAISRVGGRYVVDNTVCIECGACETACPVGAITLDGTSSKKSDLIMTKVKPSVVSVSCEGPAATVVLNVDSKRSNR